MTTPADATAETETGTTSARDRLIESIYRIALEPQTYDSFMGEWGAYIAEQTAELASLQASDEGRAQADGNPEIATHFRIAAQLLDQMGRKEAAPRAPRTGSRRNLQILVDPQGRVVWSSSTAADLFGLGRETGIEDLGLAPGQVDRLRGMALAFRAAPEAPPPPLVLHMTPRNPGLGPQYMVARALPEQAAEALVLITRITPDWPADMTRLLREGFALSPSEIEIAEHVAEGHGPTEIAALRESAVATVRTQLKKIMAKTRCSTQAELVRLLHSVMRVADQETAAQTRSWSRARQVTELALPDRVMPIEHYGDPTGYPVIFLHGMLDGNSMTHRFQTLLERHNLRLLCPVRPFFGKAGGASFPPREALPRFGQDIRHMVRDLDLQPPVLVGHMAGALYAYAAAAALGPEGARGILNISGGVPIVSRRQFAAMSRRQQLVAYTARYTPSILPFVLRAGINQIDSGGERQFLNSLYENAPHDRRLIADPDLRDLILSGYRFTVEQGHRAFEIDSHNVVHDWSEIADSATTPVRLLHGISDPVVSVESVRDFAARRDNRVHLEVLEETGQLVLYQHPDKVIREICALRDR